MKHINEYKCKCWRCANATDRNKCIWVRTLKRTYKGTVVEDGCIIDCPKFIKDDRLYNFKELKEKYNTKYYFDYKQYLEMKEARELHPTMYDYPMDKFIENNLHMLRLRKDSIQSDVKKYGLPYWRILHIRYILKNKKEYSRFNNDIGAYLKYVDNQIEISIESKKKKNKKTESKS